MNAIRKAFNIMRNQCNTGTAWSQNFWSDYRRLRMRGWVAEQGAWQWNPSPPSEIVKWNVPFKPEQLGPGNYFKMKDEADKLGLTFNMRQRIRD